MADAWIYIMANRKHGTLYIGVTSDLARRVWQHRQGTGSVFTRRYGLRRLVHVERHADISTAIQRESNLKKWRREWKLELIERENPDWLDLFDQLA